MSAPRLVRCPTIVGEERCDFRGYRVELLAHAEQAGHPTCQLCAWPLRTAADVTCIRCVTRVRDDLEAIWLHTADLQARITDGAYSGGWLTPLAMLGDGSLAGGGEDDHVRYRDPITVVALLEQWDRDWRAEFGHRRPAYKPLGHPDRQLRFVLRDVVGYLRTWLWLASRTHPAFDGFAADMRMLRSQVEHVALLIADPESAPIPCVCGGRLEQRFGDKGRSDDRVCRACGMSYDAEAYLWRYRLVTELAGWVSVERAAEACGRSEATVWAWQRSLEVPSACSRFTRRVVVELAAVVAKSEATPRVSRRSA